MNKGFTLIELLVVSGIIIVLGGIGVVSYNRFNQSRLTRNIAEDIISGLRVAQNNAQSGKKSNVCVDTPLDGWQIDLSAGLNIKEICGAETTTAINLGSFPADFSVTSVPASFIFLSPSGTTDLASDILITVTGSDGDEVIVKVTRSGEIGFPSPSST